MAPKINVATLAVELVAETQEFAKGLSGATQKAASWASAIGKVAAVGLGALVSGAGSAVGAIGAVGIALGKLAFAAAPLDGIGMAFEQMSARAGVSLEELRKGAAGTISDFELMRQANIALTGAGEEFGQAFGQALPQLLEGARAAARATGQDVDFLFQSLVTGVKRSSPMLIDNTGIVLKLGEANQAMADSLGVTVEQLTAEQKQIALLNATTEAGIKLAEDMGLSQMTAAERIAGFQTTLKNASDQIGLALAPELGNLIGILDALAQSVLGPIVDLVKNGVAPAFSLLVDQIRKVASVAEASGESFVKNLIAKLSSAAENALRWGVNITTQLATGLIQGAAQAITAAMNFISNMLSSWLSPGSPPRVALGIVEWGTAAMNEYLRGFTEASFDMLEGLQGPLQSILTSLVDTGAMGAEGARDAFRDMSAQIAVVVKDFQETGKVSTTLFDNLRKIGGEFGQDLAKLARLEINLAGAIDSVRKAEEALTKAQEKQDAAQDRLTAAQVDYNKALAEGAPPEILAAKRAEFEAAKKGLATAKDEVKQATRAQAAAKKNVDPLKAQVKLQERLIKQLTEMTKGQKEVAKSAVSAARAAVGAAGGGAALPSMAGGMGGISMPAIDTSSLDATFEDAKTRIREKLTDIFQPLTDAWAEVQPTFDEMKESWLNFTDLISGATDEKWPEIQKIIGDVFTFIVDEGTKFKDWFVDDILPIFGTSTTDFGDMWNKIVPVLDNVWNIVKKIISTASLFIRNLITFQLKMVTGDWGGAWETVKETAAEIWDAIKVIVAEFIEAVANSVGTTTEEIKETWQGIWENIQLIVETIWDNIVSGVTEKIEEVRANIEAKIDEIKIWFGTQVAIFKQIGEDLMDGLSRGIMIKVNSIIGQIREAVQRIIDTAKNALQEDSPSRVFMGIGANMMTGMAQGIAGTARLPVLATLGAVGGVTRAAQQTNHFNMNISTVSPTSTVVQDFQTMRAMVGAVG